MGTPSEVLTRWWDPLPNLRSRDLGGGRILHQPVDGRSPRSSESPRILQVSSIHSHIGVAQQNAEHGSHVGADVSCHDLDTGAVAAGPTPMLMTGCSSGRNQRMISVRILALIATHPAVG
jgi:hypothetical protein